MSRLATCLLCLLAATPPARAADDVRHDEKGTYLGVLFCPRPKASPGVILTHILPGSPAEKAQMRIGDILLRYDQTTIRDAEHLARLIRADKPDRKIALVTERDQRLRLTDVTLALGPVLKLSPPKRAADPKATTPAVTVYAAPLEGGKMRLTIEYQPVGGTKKTVTCEGAGAELAQAVEKMTKLLDQQARIELEMARLRQFIYVTRNMLPDEKRQTFDTSYKPLEKIVESGSAGLAEAIKKVLQSSAEWLSATQVRDRLVDQGFDFTHYKSNPLASISTALRRSKSQEVEISDRKGVATYRWKHRFPRLKLRDSKVPASLPSAESTKSHKK